MAAASTAYGEAMAEAIVVMEARPSKGGSVLFPALQAEASTAAIGEDQVEREVTEASHTSVGG